jgi:hypothetical protein
MPANKEQSTDQLYVISYTIYKDCETTFFKFFLTKFTILFFYRKRQKGVIIEVI